MTAQRIQWFADNEEYFSEAGKSVIFSRLEDIDDQTFARLEKTKAKKPTTALILSVLFGMWGVDRFYIKNTGMGLLKLFTAGGFIFLWIADILTIKKRTIKYNNSAFLRAMGVEEQIIEYVKSDDINSINNSYQNAVNKYNSVKNNPAYRQFKEGLKDAYDSGFVQY